MNTNMKIFNYNKMGPSMAVKFLFVPAYLQSWRACSQRRARQAIEADLTGASTKARYPIQY
jgi:hypothetical protein